MSTQPSDYAKILAMTQTTIPSTAQPSNDDDDDDPISLTQLVPAFGIHPWWLHELPETEWELTVNSHNRNSDNNRRRPKWAWDLYQALVDCPEAAVGETGLDAFHFHDPVTKEPTTPLRIQIDAFRIHLELAHELDRPVSIHCVRSFGPLMEILSQLKRTKRIPRRMYLHAFGGKEGTVDQIVALCDQVYFGFAPVVNFRSPKTAQVIRKVGLQRLVLETDHEDGKYVPESMRESLTYISSALDVSQQTLIDQTTENARELYSFEKSTISPVP